MAITTTKISDTTKKKLKEYAAKKGLLMYEVVDAAVIYLIKSKTGK
jgi:hypothetical protein